MKVVDRSSARLVVETGDRAFPEVLVALALGCAAVAAVMLFALPDAWRLDSFQGVACAAALFLAGFVALFERATFVFDRATRTLTWRRRRAFSAASGSMPFRHIREVVLQTAIGNAINPKRRIALLLADGELPLSVGYAPDVSGAARALADAIRAAIE
jgi:hypothetical protein